MLLAVATLIFLLFKMNSTKSGYVITERQYSAFGAAHAAGPTAAPPLPPMVVVWTRVPVSPLRSSPVEVASAEDLVICPEDILKGQNFLEPRAQIGFPETIGGALRNANQQIRKDPPNPKDPLRVEQLHHCP